MRFASRNSCFLPGFLALSLFLITASEGNATCSSAQDIFLNPFSRDSAHNRPIGTGAQYADADHAATRDWLRASRFVINPGTTPWGVFAVKAGPGDAVRTVGAKGESRGVPTQVRLPSEVSQRSIQLQANGHLTDSTVSVFDSTTNVVHEFYRFDWNNGKPTAHIHKKYDIRGLGHGSRPGERLGVSASGATMLFGALRGHEIKTRGHYIGHAFAMSLPGKPECPAMLGQGVKLPAAAKDWFASKPGYMRGNIPYGALMALPPSVNLNSLGLSEPGMRLAEAIRDYGIYVLDDGGCGHGAIKADQRIDPNIRNQLMNNDIPKIYRHIRMVLNSDWRPGQSAVGGGQPIAPNCAVGASASQQQVSTPSSPPASTPQSGGSGSASTNQNQQPSSGSTSSAGGTLSWPAVRNAQNYYVEIRDTTSRRERVYGRMVPPREGGCANGGTCQHAVPSLSGDRSYQWNVRAVVNGNAGSPTAWQPVGDSSQQSAASNAPAPQQSTSSGGSPAVEPTSANSAGGTLSWAAVPSAQNYYLEVRDTTTSRPERVYGRMVLPRVGGCVDGGTCEYMVSSSLPSDRTHQWAVGAVVSGEFQGLKQWRPVR